MNMHGYPATPRSGAARCACHEAITIVHGPPGLHDAIIPSVRMLRHFPFGAQGCIHLPQAAWERDWGPSDKMTYASAGRRSARCARKHSDLSVVARIILHRAAGDP